MRAKTTDFLKVLNRARPESKKTEKKTITGKTFVRKWRDDLLTQERERMPMTFARQNAYSWPSNILPVHKHSHFFLHLVIIFERMQLSEKGGGG